MARTGFNARQKVYKRRMQELKVARQTGNPVSFATPHLTLPVTPTVQAKTVFVWPRMGLRCGIAEYVRHLAAVADDGACCRSTSEVLRASHVVIVLMPSLNEPIPVLTAFARRVRSGGTRVTLDVHHMTVGHNPFAPLFPLVDDVVWHLPRIPGLAGAGRYVPLPVPTLPRADVARVGGLVHFGLGHASKRIPVMARVARDLGTRLYVYGDRNREFVPPELAPYVSTDDSYPSEAELARLLRQHDVGLIGRARWSTEMQLNGSASARFLIGAGLPAVIDQAEAHADLEAVLDVVPFDDFAQVVARARLLVDNADYRAQALEKIRQYAEATSPRRVAEQMSIAVKR